MFLPIVTNWCFRHEQQTERRKEKEGSLKRLKQKIKSIQRLKRGFTVLLQLFCLDFTHRQSCPLRVFNFTSSRRFDE